MMGVRADVRHSTQGLGPLSVERNPSCPYTIQLTIYNLFQYVLGGHSVQRTYSFAVEVRRYTLVMYPHLSQRND